ncbi:MAG: Helix-turn-helix domain, partial [Nocardia sp.]|uniref:transcriptional regulator n=1 Tax=Nocardia sp. TaxID=1821 RepID=UPI0026186E37
RLVFNGDLATGRDGIWVVPAGRPWLGESSEAVVRMMLHTMLRNAGVTDDAADIQGRSEVVGTPAQDALVSWCVAAGRQDLIRDLLEVRAWPEMQAAHDSLVAQGLDSALVRLKIELLRLRLAAGISEAYLEERPGLDTAGVEFGPDEPDRATTEARSSRDVTPMAALSEEEMELADARVGVSRELTTICADLGFPSQAGVAAATGVNRKDVVGPVMSGKAIPPARLLQRLIDLGADEIQVRRLAWRAFGLRLRELRLAKGLTVAEAALLSGVSGEWIDQIESGRFTRPSDEDVRVLCMQFTKMPIGVTRVLELLHLAGDTDELRELAPSPTGLKVAPIYREVSMAPEFGPLRHVFADLDDADTVFRLVMFYLDTGRSSADAVAQLNLAISVETALGLMVGGVRQLRMVLRQFTGQLPANTYTALQAWSTGEAFRAGLVQHTNLPPTRTMRRQLGLVSPAELLEIVTRLQPANEALLRWLSQGWASAHRPQRWSGFTREMLAEIEGLENPERKAFAELSSLLPDPPASSRERWPLTADSSENRVIKAVIPLPDAETEAGQPDTARDDEFYEPGREVTPSQTSKEIGEVVRAARLPPEWGANAVAQPGDPQRRSRPLGAEQRRRRDVITERWKPEPEAGTDNNPFVAQLRDHAEALRAQVRPALLSAWGADAAEIVVEVAFALAGERGISTPGEMNGILQEVVDKFGETEALRPHLMAKLQRLPYPAEAYLLRSAGRVAFHRAVRSLSEPKLTEVASEGWHLRGTSLPATVIDFFHVLATAMADSADVLRQADTVHDAAAAPSVEMAVRTQGIARAEVAERLSFALRRRLTVVEAAARAEAEAVARIEAAARAEIVARAEAAAIAVANRTHWAEAIARSEGEAVARAQARLARGEPMMVPAVTTAELPGARRRMGKLLAMLRVPTGLTQVQLSVAGRVAKRSITKAETGDWRAPAPLVAALLTLGARQSEVARFG